MRAADAREALRAENAAEAEGAARGVAGAGVEADAVAEADGASAAACGVAQTGVDGLVRGQVVKLDRGYPLVRCDAGALIRCEHATALVKGARTRAVIGDFVDVQVPTGHDKGIIEAIEPRTREFVRKDPTERALPQVLAANFDRVLLAQPLADVNLKRLERELVLAHETGAEVTVVLTKADLAEDERQVEEVRCRVTAIAGDVQTLVVSSENPVSVEAVRALIPAGTTAILVGKSGVGKSSLVNVLAGEELLETGDVREGDGKGRHTTVSREMVDVPGGGRIVDMPGVRGLGLWDAEAGLEAAFPDVEEAAQRCRFRDCRHGDEPGCAVRAAVERGEIAPERFASYQELKREFEEVGRRREEARRARGEKASTRRAERAAGAGAGVGKGRGKGSRSARGAGVDGRGGSAPHRKKGRRG